MHTPETSRLFTRWTNPANGVQSFILTERAAPVQQSFYYTHPSWSDDGRFLWLGCGFPPPGGRHAQQVLGVVDFERDEFRVYPETQFATARPWIDASTGEAYWGNHLEVWKRGPRADDIAVRVGAFPAELAAGEKLDRIATHPTFSADRRSVNLDARFIRPDGTRVTYVGDLPLDGAAFRLWQKIEGPIFNHGLFSPVDPDLQMLSQEYWASRQGSEPFDGARPYHRIWLIRRGEQARPLLRQPVSHSGHEWWDADGRHVWYLHYGVGVKRVDITSQEETLLWPGALSHAHSDRGGRFLVADRMDDSSHSDCHVLFRNTDTGKQVEIVKRGPLARHLTGCVHLHPHPQFCLGDRYLCHTTIVHDRVDVALVPVEPLKRLTR